MSTLRLHHASGGGASAPDGPGRRGRHGPLLFLSATIRLLTRFSLLHKSQHAPEPPLFSPGNSELAGVVSSLFYLRKNPWAELGFFHRSNPPSSPPGVQQQSADARPLWCTSVQSEAAALIRDAQKLGGLRSAGRIPSMNILSQMSGEGGDHRIEKKKKKKLQAVHVEWKGASNL